MAHNFNLNEPIVTALANQLSAQIVSAIATVNADVTDGYKLDPPVTVHGHVPVLSTLAGGGFPALAIEDMGSEFEDDLVSSVTGVHKLAVIAFISDPDPLGLAWKLRRYQQAVALCIQADRTLGGAAWTTRLKGVNPGPALEFNPGELTGKQGEQPGYLSWFAFELECPREEV